MRNSSCTNVSSPVNALTAALLSLLLLTVISINAIGKKSQFAPFPLEHIGNIDKSKFREPSGICFHPGRGTLFVVGDEGNVAEMKTDGTVIRQKRIKNADYEGITCNPSNSLLYVAIEGDEQILEIDPDNLEPLRHFEIPREYQGKTVMKAGGNGIEAITFVPNPDHPHGGTFFVANQSFDLNSPDDVSGIFELEVPLKSTDLDLKVKILSHISPGIPDISGMYYDGKTKHIFFISDKTDTIFEMTTSGAMLKTFSLPGEDQEGITADNDGFLYIAQDCGGIIKFKLK